MKKFEAPTMDVEKLEIMDVITTSDCQQDGCDNDMGEF
jgi:hypothetical protein